MAGIWQLTDKGKQFTILTTAPNDSVSPVHDRMPLVLLPEEIQPWIQKWEIAEEILSKVPPYWSVSRIMSKYHYFKKARIIHPGFFFTQKVGSAAE